MLGPRVGYVAGIVVLCLCLGIAPGGAASDARRAAEAAGRVGPEVGDALAARGRVPVMVALDTAPGAGARSAAADAVLRSVAPADFGLRHRYRGLGALAGSVTAAGLDRLLERPEVRRVDLDRPVVLHLAEAVPVTHLDVTQGLGLGGAGVTVGMIDTGVDLTHPDLAGAVTGEHCFCTTETGDGCCLDGSNAQSGPGSAQDEWGHGTWTAGTVTSDGILAPPGGAPDAFLVAVKIASATESGLDSDVVAGLDWILAERPDVDVVSLSVGTRARYAGACDAVDAVTMAYAASIAALRASGVLVVSAAGNNGSGTEMPAPACVAASLAVGATWDATFPSQTFMGCTDAPATVDTVTCWSNANSETDLMAPGGRITIPDLNSQTVTLRGTSFSAPITAACAAVMLQADPTLTPDELEASLVTSPVQVVDDTNGLVYPRLDCEAALARAIPPIPAIGGVARILVALFLVATAAAATNTRRSR